MQFSLLLKSYLLRCALAVALLNVLNAGPLRAQVWPSAPDTPRIRYEGSFHQLDDGAKRQSFWRRLLNVMIGPPPTYRMVRPFGISTDPQGRIIVVDTEQRLVHVLDYARHRYLHLAGNSKERFVSPIAVAVDEQGNIYITDSYLGKIFAFRSNGKFWRLLGDVKGEGLFKRPTGLAYDSKAHVFYLTDTLRDKIFVLDMQGRVLRSFGGRGADPGQFNFPVAIAIYQGSLYVVDAMNCRVQILDLKGNPLAQFGTPGDGSGTFAKPKSIALDSEGHIYVVDSLFEAVQVFNREGGFLLAFGGTGTGPGQFELPTGIFVDPADRIYVADSFNSRVQVFQYLKVAPDELGEP
jgi:DNA-binding beta-propeller fold protein YncE